MDYEHLQIDISDGVATVTMNRPDVLNGLHPESHAEMERVWGELGENDDVRVAILTGSGRAFCAGGDLKDMQRRLAVDPAGGSGISGASGRRIIYNLLDFEKPLIAAVNGHAVGLGCTLALLCDIVVVSDEALLGDPHITIGLVPGDGGLAVWTLLAGPNRAKEYMMLGTMASAEDALSLGLINHVVPADDVMSTSMGVAERLATGPQVALKGTKIAINNWIKAQFSSLFEASLAAELHSMAHPDFSEGVAAALAKRSPEFS
ncbi:MAG: enoyl-CoA hydratase/isomerase family protein [Acidimicrobiales bacterium]